MQEVREHRTYSCFHLSIISNSALFYSVLICRIKSTQIEYMFHLWCTYNLPQSSMLFVEPCARTNFCLELIGRKFSISFCHESSFSYFLQYCFSYYVYPYWFISTRHFLFSPVISWHLSRLDRWSRLIRKQTISSISWYLLNIEIETWIHFRECPNSCSKKDWKNYTELTFPGQTGIHRDPKNYVWLIADRPA